VSGTGRTEFGSSGETHDADSSSKGEERVQGVAEVPAQRLFTGCGAIGTKSARIALDRDRCLTPTAHRPRHRPPTPTAPPPLARAARLALVDAVVVGRLASFLALLVALAAATTSFATRSMRAHQRTP
jgi:hypothetical protein